MSVEKFNPPALHEPEGYIHVGVATGTRLVFVAGQVAFDKEGRIVGEGDLTAQTTQVMRNLVAALEAAGATFDDVAKVTIYVVDHDESKLEALGAGFGAAAGELGLEAAAFPPGTLVPVPRLAMDGLLIEIEATAVVD